MTEARDTGPPGTEVDDATGAAEPATPRPAAPGRGWKIGVLLLVLVAVALGSLTAYHAIQISRADAVRTREETILRVAEQGVLNVTSLSHQSIDADVQRLIDGSTGEYRKQFEGRSSVFRDMVVESAVVSEGNIAAAGIETSDERSGKVLVAARAQVSNKEAPRGEQRQYRMAVTVVREGDRWLVSGLEFVP